MAVGPNPWAAENLVPSFRINGRPSPMVGGVEPFGMCVQLVKVPGSASGGARGPANYGPLPWPLNRR